MHIINVQVRYKFIRLVIPDPVWVIRPTVHPLLGQLAVHVNIAIAPTMSPPLNQVRGPGSRHTNVNHGIDLAPLVGVIPQRGHKITHRLVSHGKRLGMDEDANRRQVDCLFTSIGVVGGILGSQRLQTRRQTFCDFP